jgi:adenylate cyclase
MKWKPAKYVRIWLAAGVLALVSFLEFLPRFLPSFDVVQRLEWMTYDWRVRQSFKYPGPIATNLGVIYIDDDSLSLVNRGLAFNWPWPRQLHGRLINRLKQQPPIAIGFDVLFHELQSSNAETDVQFTGGRRMGSDAYFAMQMKEAGNVALAAFGETYDGIWRAIMPAEIFRTNAWAVGHTVSEKDSDGVLRRARAYRDDRQYGRLWHLGILLAARQLGLDLSKAKIEPDRILLQGTNGVERIIPTDRDGFFYINWALTWNDKRIAKASFEEAAGFLKTQDGTAVAGPDWKDKLVFVGSIGSGNNISDVGTTPLSRDTYLVSKHWNVANSVLTDQFIRAAPVPLEFLLIVLMGSFAAFVTWRFRAPWPFVFVGATALAYVGAALSLFIQDRYWLPIILPVLGGLIFTHVVLVTYQVLFEQKEKRHVKQVFAKVVSPDVVNELLEAERLNLGGTRKKITVMFSDVRGFTEMTDQNQERAQTQARENGLSGADAEAYYDQQASETLSTVNDYLAAIADQVKRHHGTLDKYIGDCVMAFWGAPVSNDRHALDCVRAAMDAQWAMYELNKRRAEENKQREKDNVTRAASGQVPLPSLPLLTLGTGINTGYAIAGLMGSEDHILNYTVFGRDVNLAARLETVSGRGRIIIGEATYLELLRHDPELASRCVALPPVTVKGIRTPVNIYEVPWKQAGQKATDMMIRTELAVK